MPSLSSILVQRGAATMRAVEDAIARQVFHGGDLATNLLEVGAVAESVLLPLLAESLDLAAAPLGRLPAPEGRVLRLVPGELSLRHGIFPLGMEDRTLLVATAEPLSPAVEDDLGFALDLALRQVAAPLVRIRQAIAAHYGIPLERRYLRLVAKLDGQADPSPSAMPPPDRGFVPVKMPRPISIPSPTFGTGVPGGEPLPDLGARLGLERPAPKTPYVATHSFAEPAIPRSPAIPAEARVALAPTEPAMPAAAPPSRPDPGATRALAGVVRKALRAERGAAPVDKTAQPSWRAPNRRKGPFTAAMAEREMEDAATTEAVLEIVFAFATQFFVYSALFVVQGDRAEARDAAGPGADRAELAGVTAPLDRMSALARARGRRAPLVEPLADHGPDAELKRALRRAPRAVALLPLVVRTRVVAILYGDDGDVDAELSSIGDVIALIALSGHALERLALRKKLGAAAPDVSLRGVVTAPAAPPPREASVEVQRAGIEALKRVVAAAPEPSIEPPHTPAARTLPSIEEPPTASFIERADVDEEDTLALSPPDDDAVLPPSQGPRTARYLDPPLRAVRGQRPLRHTQPGIGRPALPEVTPPSPVAEEVPRPDSWIPAVALEPPEPGEAGEGAPVEHKPTPAPGRRGQAPLFEGRSAARSAPPFGFEPLPRTPPPNAIGWATPSSTPPPPHITTQRRLSERPIPREEEDGAPVRVETPRPPRIDYGGAHVAVASDPGGDVDALVQRVVDGSRAAFDDAVRAGEIIIQAVMARFPGPLRVDRHRARGELPAASQCGPVLELCVAIRRPALPFISVRLSSPDPEIRFWATHVLGELRYAEAGSALLPRLFDDDPHVRRVARRSAAALVAAGAAGEPLLKGLTDLTRNREEPITNRVLAVDTMGEIRAREVIEPLIAALEDPSDELVEAARRALLLITRQDFGREVDTWRLWWAANGSRHRIEWLIDALMHEQPSLRRAAGDELKQLTREYFGYYDDLPRRERERAQSLYRQWWEREGRERHR